MASWCSSAARRPRVRSGVTPGSTTVPGRSGRRRGRRNLGAEPRVHLVLDCEVNDFITGLLGVDLSKGRWRRVFGHRFRWYLFRLIDFVRLLRYDRKTLMDRLRSLPLTIRTRIGG